MMSGCASSFPRPKARKEEVMRFIQRIEIGERGKTEELFLSRNERPIRRRITWAMFDMRRLRRNYDGLLVYAVSDSILKG